MGGRDRAFGGCPRPRKFNCNGHCRHWVWYRTLTPSPINITLRNLRHGGQRCCGDDALDCSVHRLADLNRSNETSRDRVLASVNPFGKILIAIRIIYCLIKRDLHRRLIKHDFLPAGMVSADLNQVYEFVD